MRKYLLFLILFLSSTVLFSQGTGTLASDITKWKEDLSTVLKAAVAVFAIGGGFLVFFQYMQGSEQAQRNFIRFLIGLAIFGLVDAIVGFFITT